jgi:hypothetical protein
MRAAARELNVDFDALLDRAAAHFQERSPRRLTLTDLEVQSLIDDDDRTGL